MTDLSLVCIEPEKKIREAMESIDRNSKGIVLVCTEGRLLGTITDGDIRRAILVGTDLDEPLETILAHKRQLSSAGPATAPVDTDDATVLKLMREHCIRQVPLVDPHGRVEDLLTIDELVPDDVLPMEAVIMAGGYGKRLRPLTEHLPKPMLPVGGRPLLQRTIERLRDAGISRVNLTTHYKADVIQKHFGDGSEFGVEIRYVEEDQPMGTAGALCLLNNTSQPLLIINADILTNVDFRAMFEFHREHEAYMTIAVKQIQISVPYGVLKIDAGGVIGITEKPVMRQFINAGIYLLNPDACASIPQDKPYDMPDLINHLVAVNKRVVAFPIREYWLDIGKMEHYRQAQDDVGRGDV
jgi:dTDP-glucose pyrophosphorylase/CBS domain-containing protein